ncbi:MAG: PKD domain-containing protein [Chitinophagaceae bacterium]
MLPLTRPAFLLLACSFHFLCAAQNNTCSAAFTYSAAVGKVLTFYSADSSGTKHLWTFGDGTAVIITSNGIQAHQYAQAGRYEVKHVIEKPGANCRDSAVKIITIAGEDSCHAGFNWQSVPVVPPGANGYRYQFTNTSMAYSDIKFYKWTFGDGSSATDKNPAHNYLQAGNYRVCLRIETSTGCVSEICKQLQITTDSCGLNPRYSWKKDSLDCKKIRFTNLSATVLPSTHFIWKFGDGSSSQDLNPAHIYAQPGKYYVCLVSETGTGCRAEYCDSVLVSCETACNLSARFEWKKDSSNCKKIRFSNLSNPMTASTHVAWKFGDGEGSNDINPSHIYKEAGKYLVCLVVEAGNNCTRSYCDSVTVRCEENCNIQPAFTWKADEAMPDKVSFKNLTTPAVATVHYVWKFGDNSSSAEVNPVHVYDHAGKYNVCLVTEMGSSCRKEVCQQVEIKNCSVTARFETKRDAAKWNTVYLNNVTAPVNNVWQTYWSYGDGSSSRDYNSVHSYEKPGVYSVCLKVISLGGCTSYYCDSVRVIKPDSCEQKAAFNYYRSSAGALNIKFEALYQNNTAAYNWNFGDSTVGAGRLAYHVYSRPGKYRVCLTVKDAQCAVTHCQEMLIEKPAPDPGRVALYPNPTVNTVLLELKMEQPAPVSITILDGSGAMKGVYYKNGVTGINRFTFPVDKLSQGLYLVEIKTNAGTWFSRFVKG